MAYTCGHCSRTHQHVAQARGCAVLYGGTDPDARALHYMTKRMPARPYVKQVVAPISKNQLDYLISMGLDLWPDKVAEAQREWSNLSRAKASKTIDQVKAMHEVWKRRRYYVTVPTVGSIRPQTTTVQQIMLETLRDGYYAGEVTENATEFFRVSRPTRSHWKGWVKVQRVTGSVGGFKLQPIMAISPQGKLIVMDNRYDAELNVVMCDTAYAARLFGKRLEACCRCAAHLTDPFSRHYTIGPECVKHWPWMIEAVDEENDGLTFDQLNLAVTA